MLIPKNTSVLIRRVPGRPRLPIVTKQEYDLKPLIKWFLYKLMLHVCLILLSNLYHIIFLK